jgi:4-amino-4-deoxy-L-arabinose transferase-like glycosyltransferase
MSMVSTPAPSVASPSRSPFWLAFDRLTSGAKGPLLAAALVLVSALPGIFALPPLDRDEARFAQASAQMLETGDLVDIRYLGDARNKKPVGIHWFQAASVQLVSAVERRQIWAYRLPSLLGAMVAAAACVWGASSFFTGRAAVFAGAILGASLLLSSEAFIAKTDAVLCGAITLSMAALCRLYGASRGIGEAGRGVKALFWFGQAIAILDKGPVGPMVAALALVALALADRQGRWIKTLGWLWGALLIGLIVGPWALAITVVTDGGFWTEAVGGDMAAKVLGARERHGAPPGLHLLLLPLLIFPASLLLPAAAVAGWRERASPGVRFALCWLIPTWIVFELSPTKLVHYTLPLYGAVAWLMAAALNDPARAAFRPRVRWIGGSLSIVCGLVIAAGAITATVLYGGASAFAWAGLSALLASATGIVGAVALGKRRIEAGLLACLILGVGAHLALTGLAPRLTALWPSARVAERLIKDHLDPRNGVTTGPVALVGYAEPSLVFALGSGTELDNAADGADSVSDGQPAIVEQRQDAAFRAALAAGHIPAEPVETVRGFDYSLGKRVALTIWRSLAPSTPDAP